MSWKNCESNLGKTAWYKFFSLITDHYSITMRQQHEKIIRKKSLQIFLIYLVYTPKRINYLASSVQHDTQALAFFTYISSLKDIEPFKCLSTKRHQSSLYMTEKIIKACNSCTAEFWLLLNNSLCSLLSAYFIFLAYLRQSFL